MLNFDDFDGNPKRRDLYVTALARLHQDWLSGITSAHYPSLFPQASLRFNQVRSNGHFRVPSICLISFRKIAFVCDNRSIIPVVLKVVSAQQNYRER